MGGCEAQREVGLGLGLGLAAITSDAIRAEHAPQLRHI